MTTLTDTDPTTEPASTTGHATWSLGIATYNRHEVLIQCLKLAAAQTRLPKEIAVVDASNDWERTRDVVLNELAPRHPEIQWIYEQARRPSAAVQRNQAAEITSADVVFLIDDDSFMYPDTAEELMKVYDADQRKQVAGVAMVLAAKPPSEAEDEKAVEEIEAARVAPTVKNYSPVVKAIRKLLDADNLFVPYDEDFPNHPVPESVKHLRVGTRELMAGMTMTARREWVLEDRFSEILADRGPEDSDVSYRLSRRGAVLTALNAKLFHVGSPAGRFSSYSREALGMIGPIVLHRFYSTDLERSRRATRKMLRRRMLIGLAKDIKSKEFDLPRFRGARFSLSYLDRILAMSTDEIEAWYPQFQKDVIAGDNMRGTKK
ncbi:MAG: glycosyltransferase family 2 protein [Phycisphaeraceae bacterium]